MARADLPDRHLMLLGISSAAAPDATLADLVAACARRGLAVLELRGVDTHGVMFDGAAVEADLVSGILPAAVDDVDSLAQASQALSAHVIVPGDVPLAERIGSARAIRDAGGHALPLMTGDARDWLDVVSAHAIEYAWEIDPAMSDVARDSSLMLHHADRRPSYIRFLGGGPETTQQDGFGIGMLMARLAVAGYGGPLIMAPSTTRYLTAWSTWLGRRRGGTGCGSAGDDRTLVRLS